jgi:mannose-1-phosphate guanylyltransferase
MPTLPFLNRKNSWAVVLAGGDGTRLQSLTQMICGDERPKQFCPVFGGKSLLAHTRQRLRPLFRSDHTLCVVTRTHEDFYRDELDDANGSRIIVQPMNRGTGIGVAIALLRILQLDPEATVAFFPADHYYSDVDAFSTTVASALRFAEQYPHSPILIGAEARYPEMEYGWIEPGRTIADSLNAPLHLVSRFWEKPFLRRAQTLLRRGCLWNTFITIGWAGAFVELLQATVPHVWRDLEASISELGSDRAYRQIPSVDLSRDVMAVQPRRLLVLRDNASGWADFGSPARVVDTLVRDGIEPAWLREFRGATTSSSTARGSRPTARNVVELRAAAAREAGRP